MTLLRSGPIVGGPPSCPVCGTEGHTCTSGDYDPASSADGIVIVREPPMTAYVVAPARLYRELADGRVVLAYAEGDMVPHDEADEFDLLVPSDDDANVAVMDEKKQDAPAQTKKVARPRATKKRTA